MKLVFSENAWEDYLYWQKTNNKRFWVQRFRSSGFSPATGQKILAGLIEKVTDEFFPFKKDGATRGASACAARATSTIIQSAILMDS
jgi:hypothetical protein